MKDGNVEIIRFLESRVEALVEELMNRADMIKELEDKVAAQAKVIDELRGAVEDVSVGTKLECAACGDLMPCLCKSK